MKNKVRTVIRKLDKEWNYKYSQMRKRFTDSPLNVGKSWEDEEGNLFVESLDVNFDDTYLLNGEKVNLRICDGRQAFFTQRWLDGRKGRDDSYIWDFKVFIHDLERNKFKLELYID